MIDSLPEDKILHWLKLKTFADCKIKLNEKSKLILRKVENSVGYGENPGKQNFFLFLECFQKPSP